MAETGLEIMEERERRHQRPFEESWVAMHLYNKKGEKREERVMLTYSMEDETGLDRRLVKFASPPDIRGVGLLTWEQPAEKEDDQWLHLPATRQVKRIAGSGKKNAFMGTDLAFEDLRPENLSTHRYELKGEAVVDGANCWVVEAFPNTTKEERDSGYSKRVFYIRKDIYFDIKVEYYGRRGRLEKVSLAKQVVAVKGEAHRANLAVTQRMREGTKTILVHQKRVLDEELDSTLFTQQGLKRPLSAN